MQNPDFRHQVVLKVLKSGDEQILPFPLGYKLGPAFCRQGKGVIVRIPTTERDGTGGVYIIDLRTLKVERLPKIPGGTLNSKRN